MERHNEAPEVLEWARVKCQVADRGVVPRDIIFEMYRNEAVPRYLELRVNQKIGCKCLDRTVKVAKAKKCGEQAQAAVGRGAQPI